MSASHRSWAVALLLAAPSLIGANVASASEASSAAVERGKYLALAGNCAACHTAPEGAAFAGGLAFETPFGTIYSTNITPDPDTGIGKWTSEQFLQALRQGVRANGEHLYPVFPYTSFTKITDADAAALFAYLKSLPAVGSNAPANDMSFPYSQRWLMAAWNAMFFTEGPYQPDPKKSAVWNRGAYLVEGLGHCSACHSPRNFLGAESSDAAFTGGVYNDKIPGGAVRQWSAPNLTAASTGLAAWPVAEIAAYLKTGKNAHTVTFGPMNDVIMNSTRHLSDADLTAMATYLKSLQANFGDVGAPASADVMQAGSTVYDVHCGTCHLPTGLGSADTGPALAGSLVVQANDPSSLINVILHGPQLPEPAPDLGHWQPMEAYGEKLTDEEVAQLASYVRNSWDNKGGAVTPEQVAKQR
jgi:mono/diheme cytochrome c family protein